MSDMSLLSIEVNPVLLVVVPLGFAFALPLFGFISKKIIKYIPVAAFLFNLVVALLLIPDVLKQPIVVRIGGFPPPFCINLVGWSCRDSVFSFNSAHRAFGSYLCIGIH